MESYYEHELETMLKLTEEKLELCIKMNNNPAKKARLFNEYFILLNLLNQKSETTIEVKKESFIIKKYSFNHYIIRKNKNIVSP